MRKILFFVTFCFAFVVCSFAGDVTIYDEVFIENGVMYHVLADGSLEVVKGDGVDYEGDVVIAPVLTYNGVPRKVTRIAYRAFYQNKKIRTVTLPHTLKVIEQAFVESGLQRISIPASVDTVAYQCFLGCESLKEFILEDADTPVAMDLMSDCDSLEYIYKGRDIIPMNRYWSPFASKPSLTRLDISDHVTKIALSEFSDNSRLKKVIIPASVKFIDEYAFQNCDSLREIDLGPSVEVLGSNAFTAGCVSKFVIPGSLREIGSYALRFLITDSLIFAPGATTLSELPYGGINLAIADSLKYFELRRNIDNKGNSIHNLNNAEIVIGDEVTSLPDNLFHSCQALGELNLPNLKYIGASCFAGSSLSDIKLSPKIEHIGKRAFSYTKLRTFDYDFENLDSIQEEVLSNCKNLKSINIDDGVRYIGPSAFYRCDSLENVRLPQSLSHICRQAFNSSSRKLFNGKLRFGNSIDTIEGGAFGRYIQEVYFDTEKPVTLNRGALSSISRLVLPFEGIKRNRGEQKGNESFDGLSSAHISSGDKFDVYSLNRRVPVADAFNKNKKTDGTYYIKGTLHVPAGTVDAYRADSIFGLFENITDDLVGEEPRGVTAGAELTVTAECQPFAEGAELTLYADAAKTEEVGRAVGSFESSSRASRSMTFRFDGLTAYKELYYRLSSVDAEGEKIAMSAGIIRVNDPTAIDSIEADGSDADQKEIYDLQGRRLNEPRRGTVNIINGRKVIVR